MSAKVVRGEIRKWTNRKHEKYWQSFVDKDRLRAFLKDRLLNELGELLNLSRTT
jgi:hypothetical protein